MVIDEASLAIIAEINVLLFLRFSANAAPNTIAPLIPSNRNPVESSDQDNSKLAEVPSQFRPLTFDNQTLRRLEGASCAAAVPKLTSGSGIQLN